MPAFAVAIIDETKMNNDTKAYLEQIDETLRPFSGVYRSHGGPYVVLEGSWEDNLVLLEFPDLGSAEAWYHSDAYQAIQPLRTNNSTGSVFLV